ncbi:MAG TPA: hemerythrin domain-containing protein [Burkholderiales bacterium]|nr:hemerythrin domain-containing protein [Burkholderiales bacterium]
MSKTLNVIRDEHRSIAAVLHGMQYFVERLRSRKGRVDPRVFRAMLYYLDTFTERMHHVKEDKYLFSALRRRGRAEALIAGLEKEHAAGEDALRRLEQCLLRYEEGGEAEFEAFAEEAERFVDGYWEHMRKEEEQVFPLALELLTAQDWTEIDRAFEENLDPLAAERETKDYQRLFARIVSLAPPPIGLGPVV